MKLFIGLTDFKWFSFSKTRVSYLFLLMIISCGHHHDYEAPDFTLPDVHGNYVNLYTMLREGPVVFVPWALWCKICIKELDSLKPHVYDIKYPKVHFLAISHDAARNYDAVLSFAEDHQWLPYYRVLLDTGRTIVPLYGIEALPTTIAIAQDGDILLKWQGYHTGDEILIIDTLRQLFGR
jgi:peroxiredoxin